MMQNLAWVFYMWLCERKSIFRYTFSFRQSHFDSFVQLLFFKETHSSLFFLSLGGAGPSNITISTIACHENSSS